MEDSVLKWQKNILSNGRGVRGGKKRKNWVVRGRLGIRKVKEKYCRILCRDKSAEFMRVT